MRGEGRRPKGEREAKDKSKKAGQTSRATKKSKEWDDIWGAEEEESKEAFANPELFFGRTAKDKFWTMYK